MKSWLHWMIRLQTLSRSGDDTLTTFAELVETSLTPGSDGGSDMEGMAGPRVTLVDVARAAQVSASTVSRVLHGGAGVRDEVANRVRQVAADLGYSVNRQARSLRRGRDEAIGLAVEDFAIPFFGRIVSVVEQAAHERGYGVIISCAGSGRSEAEAVGPLLSRSVAGLVVATGTAGAPEGYLAQVARELPVVQVDAPTASPVSDAVGIDNVAAGRILAEHVLAYGHRNVLFVGSGYAASTVLLRAKGVRDAMRESGAEAREAWLGYVPAETTREAVAALTAHPEVTAVISGVSRTTMGLMSAIRQLGRTDLAVAAVDDLAGADAFDPGLTVLEQDVEAIGSIGAELLFGRIDGYEGPPRHIEVELTLLRRGSAERGPAMPEPERDRRAGPAAAER
jgi:LacI family transcriptional regulator